ncbi:MAG: creatininase family protein [Deltaproteobacteria bacterium]|nr:creatininase family protein [Deltaproteobacteria bacterium]
MLVHEITMKEFKEGLKKTKTLIVPFGTVEAHGAHLPLSTDTIIIWEAVKEAVKKQPAFVAPPIHYGVCTSTGAHPGTLGIRPGTLRRIAKDIVRDGYTKGLRDFILISGHGGSIHSSAMREAGETLISELDNIRLAVLTIYDITKKELSGIVQTPDDSHAGEMETSLILFLRPNLVKGRGKKERPCLPRPFIVKDKVKYWLGAIDGDPTKATKKKGELAFALMNEKIQGLIKEIGR